MQSVSSMPWLMPLAGGLLIGLASWLLLASLGRVAGISGIVASGLPSVSVANERPEDGTWRKMFLIGLIAGGALMSAVMPAGAIGAAAVSMPVLLLAGLLVGVGTVLGSGCTSGHGICGLGRRSVRSLVAVVVFMGIGMLTVALVQALK
jgi:uncharacterized protein